MSSDKIVSMMMMMMLMRMWDGWLHYSVNLFLLSVISNDQADVGSLARHGEE
jgi:hypothetical protein